MTEPFKTASDLRAARSKTPSAESHRAAMGAVGWLIIFTVLSPLEAWILMLALGSLHIAGAPWAAVGYGTALLTVLLVDLVGFMAGRFRRQK
ncbi:hypothetical protein [Streptomyces sp. NBC_00239]|uniref:hypothetical protein n=1 Tax=Streptomyces sp. NBC_00239 TaxID=2903640 RepID=UPI002E2C04AA|nr:hypothetical protein [Streptomyces sp. NBC_00239]